MVTFSIKFFWTKIEHDLIYLTFTIWHKAKQYYKNGHAKKKLDKILKEEMLFISFVLDCELWNACVPEWW